MPDSIHFQGLTQYVKLGQHLAKTDRAGVEG